MALLEYRKKLADSLNENTMHGGKGLLAYNDRYHILICRECMYAVQKQALESHLLRHKIYRKERQQLLNEISRYDLLEPEDVPHPTPGSIIAPISELPVISGLRCDVAGCRRLLASSKQMKKHGVESHGINTPVETFAREAHLQTFFRGTKLRYFEVIPSRSVSTSKATARSASSVASGSRSSSPNDKPTVQASELATPTNTEAPPLSPLEISLQLNLQAFQYFHHYHSFTSRTLPLIDTSQRLKYWQACVPRIALSGTILTRGLLAITAVHQWHLSQSHSEREHHREQFQAFQQDGLKEFLRYNVAKCEAGQTSCGAQLLCLIRCCSWSIGVDSEIDREPLSLVSAMATIRGAGDPDNAFTLLYPHDQSESENLFLSSETLWTQRIQRVEASQGEHPPSIVLQLQKLPYHMAEIFSQPDAETTADLLIALQAAQSMVDCCFLSFADEATQDDAWAGMVLWLDRLPSRFHGLVAEKAPAAMLIMAYWSFLVRRAAGKGSWFLSGIGERIYWLARSELVALPQAYALVEHPDWLRCDAPIEYLSQSHAV